MLRFRMLGLCLVLVLFWLVACDSAPPLPEIPTRIAAPAATIQPAASPEALPSLPPVPTVLQPIATSAAAVITPQISPTAVPAAARVTSKLGIHLMLDDKQSHWTAETWPQHLRYARALVGEWGFVEVLIRLDDLDVEKWQFFLDECWRRHLTPVIRFATFYDNEHKWWAAPIRDNEGGGYFTVAEQYRDFLDHMKWPITPRYIIVGNEPNRGDEWENQPNGAAYAHFLGDVSRRLKEFWG